MNSSSQLYHCFALDFIWADLTNTLVKQNSSQEIEILRMPRLSQNFLTNRQKVKEGKNILAEAWNRMKITNDNDNAWFATHIELEDISSLKNTLMKLEPHFKLDSDNDLQRAYGFKLNGINEPQFFFKGDGAWTGLHNEDCGLASFNINVGPGTSHWTFIDEAEMKKLSSVVKNHLKRKTAVDLKMMNHQYFFNEDFLKEFDIKFEAIDQLPGQAIYVPGYSYHQVYNKGCGLNLAYNLGYS